MKIVRFNKDEHQHHIELLTEILHRAYAPLAKDGMRYLASHQPPSKTLERMLEGTESYLAFLDSKLVGTVTLYTEDVESTCEYYRRPGVFSFGQFAIDPTHQGLGFGSELMDFIESRARELGATELALDTSEKASQLIQMYKSRGYAQVSTAQWSVTNYLSVILAKKLTRPIAKIYQEESHFWDKQRSQSQFTEIKYLSQIASQIPKKGDVLDLGCGSGRPIGKYFIEEGHQVTGIDIAPAMIEKAASLFPQHQWAIADMRTLNLNKKFHGIVAWDSFFHLTVSEQKRMFPIFRQHLFQNGLLLFTSGPKHGEAIGDMNGQPLFHASLAPNEYRALFLENGFQEIGFFPEDPTCGGHTVWIAQLKTP